MNGLISSGECHVPKHAAPRPTKRYVPRHAAPRRAGRHASRAAAPRVLKPVAGIGLAIAAVPAIKIVIGFIKNRRRHGISPRRSAAPPLGMVDRLMIGVASGLGSTSMLVPTLGLRLFTTQFGIPDGAIIGIAQAAPWALVVVQWLFFRRGGMIGWRMPGRPRADSRPAVVAFWALAALGLVGIALTRVHGWLAIPIVAACMAAVGAGQSVGYHVQNNKLGEIEENNSGHSRGTPDRTSVVGTAASLAQQWTLLSGVASSLLLAFAMERFGVRPAIAGLAVVVAVFALLHLRWSGLPEAKPGAGKGGVFALLSQSDEVKRDLYGNFVLYGAWVGALYPILALLGAGPAAQALISSFARGTAAVFAAWLGRMADTGRQRLLRIAAYLAVGGAVLFALSRSSLGWTLAGLGVATTEIGCNGVAGALKGSFARDPERVRLMHAGTLFRFAGQGFWALSVACAWLVFSRQSIELARGIVTVGLVALLVAVCGIVPQVVRRPGTHHMKVDEGDGKVVLAALPAAAHAPTSRWFYVGLAGRRQFYELQHDELLTLIGRSSKRERCLLTLHASPHARSYGRHRRQSGNIPLRERRTVPLFIPGVPGRSLKLVDVNNGKRGVTTVFKFTFATVRSSVSRRSEDKLPSFLRESIEHGPSPMRRDTDRAGTVIYCVLKSNAFRGRLRVDAHLSPERERTQSPTGDQHGTPQRAHQRRAGRRRSPQPTRESLHPRAVTNRRPMRGG